MDNRFEKVKKLRKEVKKIFFLLFIPHVLTCIVTSQVVTNLDILIWQLYWFLFYSLISFLVYVFAYRIIKITEKK